MNNDVECWKPFNSLWGIWIFREAWLWKIWLGLQSYAKRNRYDWLIHKLKNILLNIRGQIFAAKHVTCKRASEKKRIMEEVDILGSINFPKIMRLYRYRIIFGWVFLSKYFLLFSECLLIWRTVWMMTLCSYWSISQAGNLNLHRWEMRVYCRRWPLQQDYEQPGGLHGAWYFSVCEANYPG